MSRFLEKCVPRVAAIAFFSLEFLHIGVALAIEWATVSKHIQIRREVTWVSLDKANKLSLTLIRFHLGYTELELIDVRSMINSGQVSAGGQQFPTFDLDATYAQLDEKKKPNVLAAAGWSSSTRISNHEGMLVIEGKIIHPPSRQSVLTAFLCLHDPVRYPRHRYLVPIAYNVKRGGFESQVASKCPDGVQAGPRIIEEGGKRGIKEAELDRPASARTIFAVDEANRPTRDIYHPDAARNAYLILVHNRAHLFQVQQMLLDDKFWNDDNDTKIHWAINLVGGNQSGLIINSGTEIEKIENTSAAIGSALFIRDRVLEEAKR
jgi:hypothetical protein